MLLFEYLEIHTVCAITHFRLVLYVNLFSDLNAKIKDP